MKRTNRLLETPIGAISFAQLSPVIPNKNGDNLLFCPGWGNGDNGEYHRLLADWPGQSTILVPEYNSGTRVSPQAASGLHQTQATKTAICRDLLLHQLMQEKNGPVELVGYSEGAIHAVLAAKAAANKGLLDRIKKLTLICPAGIAPAEKPNQIVWRVVRDKIENFSRLPFLEKEARASVFKHWKSVTRYNREFPGANSADGINAGQIEVSSVLKDLIDAGLKVKIIVCQDDRMIEFQALAKFVLDQSLSRPVKFRVVKGGHQTIFTHPERILEVL